MMKAKDIMTKKEGLITVSPQTKIAQAAKVLWENGINGVPVIDESGKLVGIVCQSDLITQQKKLPLPSLFTVLDSFVPLSSMRRLEKDVQKITGTTVADAMSPNPVTVDLNTDIDEVASLMVDKKYHTLPVMDGGELVGIVGKEDVLRTLMSSNGQ
jgi:CBS domain-containing protein